MTSTIDAVQGWISQLQSNLDALPQALAQAAPTGDFASVFAGVQAEFAGPNGAATASSNDATSSTDASETSGEGSATTGASPSGAAVVAEAQQFLGVPYVWGGTSPSGFDCSGLVQYVYGQLGVSLPRTSEEQAQAGTPVASLADAQPGDLVFFAGSDGTPTSPGHVGIYLGNGQMIDAPETGENVSVQPVGQPVAIRRIVPTPSVAGSSADAATTSGGSTPYSVPSSLAPDFLSAAAKYNVPAQLLTAVAYQESGFNTNAVSSAGAEGLMQLMPSTASGLGVDPFNPAQSIDGAAQLLSGYLTQYQSLPLALAAYNAGPGAVAAAGNAVPAIPQTQTDVNNILNMLGGTSS